MGVMQRIREFFGLPMRPGDSWKKADGSTLTYLGQAPDPWETKTCGVCDGPATQYKTLPPWPGTSYAHTSMACDEHASYLDGVSWAKCGESEWEEAPSWKSICMTCQAPYGHCTHTAGFAAMLRAQELAAVRGRL